MGECVEVNLRNSEDVASYVVNWLFELEESGFGSNNRFHLTLGEVDYLVQELKNFIDPGKHNFIGLEGGRTLYEEVAEQVMRSFEENGYSFPLFNDTTALAEALRTNFINYDFAPEKDHTTNVIQNNLALGQSTEVYDSRFLTKAYGSAQAAQLRATNHMSLGLVSSLLANRGYIQGTLGFSNKMVGASEINAYVRLYLEQLFRTLCDYIKGHIINVYNENAKQRYSEGIKALNETLYDVDTNGVTYYTGAFHKVMQDFAQNFNNINETALIRATENNDYNLLDAFEAWVTLSNFDSGIKLLFGDAINIENEINTFNAFTGTNKYSISNKGDQMNKSWRNSEEYFLDQEVSRLTQRLIETTQMVDEYGNPLQDRYLKFLDFVAVMCEVKDLAYYADTAKLNLTDQLGLPEESRPYKFDQSTINYIQKLLKRRNKSITLKDVITSLVENPQQAASAIFDILSQETLWNSAEFKTFTDNLQARNMRSLIMTIHNGITRENFNNSLHSIRNKGKISGTNYYNYVTQIMTSIFKNNFLQAYYDPNTSTFNVRTLYEQGVADRKRRMLENILMVNNYQAIGNYMQLAEDFSITNNYDIGPDTEFGIQFILPFTAKIGETETKIGLKVSTDNFGGIKSIKVSDLPKSGDWGEAHWVNDLDLEIIDKQTDLLNNTWINELLDPMGLVESVLKLNLKQSPDFFKYFLEGNPDYQFEASKVFMDLLSLAAHVLTNRTNSGKLIMWEFKNDSGTYKVKDEVSRDLITTRTKQIYGTPLQVDNNTGEFNLLLVFDRSAVSRTSSVTLSNLAAAKAKADGLGRASQIQDADRKSVSNNTLSRLIGSVTSQMDILCATADSASNEFSIVSKPGLLKGFYKFHEVSTLDGAKRTTQFNDAELNTAAFVLNFLDGLAPLDEAKSHYPIGNGRVGLLASVNSDKSFIDFMIVDLRNTLSGIKGKTYEQLNLQEIKLLIATEIGQAYKKVLDHVQEDYNKLFKFGNLLVDKGVVIPGLECLNDLLDWLYLDSIKGTNLGNYYMLFQEYANTQGIKDLALFSQPFIDWFRTINDNDAHVDFDSLTPGSWDSYSAEIPHDEIDGDGNVVPTKHGFPKLKEWVKYYNKKHPGSEINLQNLIKKLCLEYNRRHRLDPIELVENIHMNKGLGANETLINLIDRFSNQSNLEEFWKVKEAELVKGLLTDGFEYTIDLNKASSLLLLTLDNGSWVDPATNKMILAKIAINGQVIDLTSRADLKSIALSRNIEINSARDLINLGQLLVNPYLQKWNLFDYYFTLQHLLTSVGSHIAHPSKGYAEVKISSTIMDTATRRRMTLDNQLAEEAARFFAQHKRNVSLTAAMHEFLLNLIDGIPSMYNIASIRDVKDTLYNLVGKLVDDIKPYDGATFVHPVIVRLENNSLGAEKAGNSKKQFVHFYNHRNMNGGIIKTCGFGITNALVRDTTEGNIMANMLKKMMWNRWISHTGLEITDDGKLYNDMGNEIGRADFSIDLFGNSLTNGENRAYEDIYYYQNGHFWKRVFDTTDTKYTVGDDTYSAMVVNKDGSYTFNDVMVNEQGLIIENDGQVEINSAEGIKVFSNWDAYTKLFKGQFCYEVNFKEFKDNNLHYSETSLENLTTLVNNMGYIRGNDVSADLVEVLDDVWQPAKHSDIHYLVTEGAIKQGSANMNEESLYYDDSVLNFQRIRANQIGIQLDKEHHADKEELSIMNQVIQACSERGFSEEKAHQLYRTLFALTRFGLKTLLEEFRKLTINKTITPEFSKTIELIVKKAILNSGPKDGNLINNIAANIEKQLRNNPAITLRDLDANIPYSESSLFSKLNAIVAAFINRAGIKQKLDGVLSVLNPSHRIKRIYGGHLIDYFRPEDSTLITINDAVKGNIQVNVPTALLQALNEVAELVDLNDINKTLGNFAGNVTMGAYYLVTIGNNLISRYIRTNQDYKALKKEIINNWGKPNGITSIKEHIIRGRELSHYNAIFQDEAGNTYNMYDLDSSSLLFDITPLYKELNSLKDRNSAKIKAILTQPKYTKVLNDLSNSEIGHFFPNYERMAANIRNNPLYANNATLLEVVNRLNTSIGISNIQKGIELAAYVSRNRYRNMDEALADLYKKVLTSILTAPTYLRRLVQRDLKAITHEVKANPLNRQLITDLQSLELEYRNSYDLLEAHFDSTRIQNPTEDQIRMANLEYNKAFQDLNNEYIEKLNEIIKTDDPVLINRGSSYHEGNDFMLALLNEKVRASSNLNNLVRINNQEVYVNKDSVVVKPYEVVMPLVFRSTLGLGSAADMNTIANDPLYFYNLAKLKWESKTQHFDYEFKSLNGNRYYVLNRSNLLKHPGLIKKTIFQNYERDRDSFSRVTPSRQHMYKMYSNNGKDDEIWVDGDTEIIVTDNPEFYRDNLSYNTININLNNDGYLIGEFIFNALHSKKKAAQRWAEALLSAEHNALRKYASNFDKTSPKYGKTGELSLPSFKADLEESLLKNIDYWDKRLKNEGLEIHTSFLKTLGVVAARIPAQSLQSFMPMQIAAYDTVDVNSAYVSTAQIWLQGSDYDVDAVSLASYSLNKAGKFVHWSKYVNLQDIKLLNASSSMPFPTGETATLLNIDLTPSNVESILAPFSSRQITLNLLKVGLAELERKYKNSLDLFKAIVAEANDPNGAFRIEKQGGKNVFKVNEVDLYNINNRIAEATDEVEKAKLQLERELLILKGVKQTERLAEILQFYDDFGIIDIRKLVDREGNVITQEIDNNLFQSLIDIINDYNDYINDKHLSEEEKVLMAKNSVMDGMYQTTLRPINLIESLTSVDDTTRPFKDKGNEAPISKELSTFTPGNAENKIRAIVINQVGKEGIGICAVGTKSFSAWTAYCNHLLNRGTSLQLKNILINSKRNGLNLFGKNYNTLANVHALDLKTVVNDEVLKALLQVNLDKDAIIDISALLSLATDNAKELCLGKLNAGTKTIGMYIYGLSVGIPFDTVATLLMSPMGITVKELLEGNVFNNSLITMNTLSAALNYLTVGPRRLLSNIDPNLEKDIKASLTARARSINLILPDELFDAVARFAHTRNIPLVDKISTLKTLIDAKDVIAKAKALEQAISSETNPDNIAIIRNNYQKAIERNRIVTELINYLYLVDTIYDEKTRKVEEFGDKFWYDKGSAKNTPVALRMLETLAGGADEMKTFGSILSSNNGVKTKLGESMAFMKKLRQLVSNRHLSNYERRVREWYMKPVKSKEINGNTKYYRTDEAGGEEKYPKSESNSNWDLDFVRFMTEEDYALSKIQSYDSIKHSVNILDVIHEVPHFNGYLLGVALDYAGKKSVSAKYRAIEHLGDQAIELLHATTQKDIEAIYGRVGDLVSDKIRRKWMEDKNLRFTVSPGQYYFNSDHELVLATLEETLFLGTDDGDATFKYWMETYVFPKITRGMEYSPSGEATGTVPILRNNRFLQGLQLIITDRTPLHVTTNMYTLGINMMPRNDNERGLLNSYRNQFNGLSGIHTKFGPSLLTYLQLIWLYNQIVTLGKPGQNNLTSIFDDFNVQDDLVQSYYEYVHEFDLSRDIVLGIDVNRNELIKWVAPIRHAYSSNLNYIYTLNPKTMHLELQEKNIQSSDSSFELDDMLDYDDMLEGDQYATEDLPYKRSSIGNLPKYKQYYLRGITYNTDVGVIHKITPVSVSEGLSVVIKRTGDKYSSISVKLRANPKGDVKNLLRLLQFDYKNPYNIAVRNALFGGNFTESELKDEIIKVIDERTVSDDNIYGMSKDEAISLKANLLRLVDELQSLMAHPQPFDVAKFEEKLKNEFLNKPIETVQVYKSGGWVTDINVEEINNIVEGIKNEVILNCA